MYRSLKVVAAVLLILSCTYTLYAAEEEPELKLDVWKLTLKPLKADTIVVERASGTARLDWYLVYAVTNETDQPRSLSLHITAELFDSEEAAAADEKKDPLLTGLGIGKPHKVKQVSVPLPELESAVERKMGEQLLGPADIAPRRRKALKAKGEARAKALEELQRFLTIKPKETRRCIATFGPLDPQAHVVKIYVRNLTGTVGIIQKDGKRILREYVLVLKYRIPGDEFGRVEDRFIYVGKKWIAVEREVPPIPAAGGGKK